MPSTDFSGLPDHPELAGALGSWGVALTAVGALVALLLSFVVLYLAIEVGP